MDLMHLSLIKTDKSRALTYTIV
ncbi:hypothetical protein V1478_018140 [Vespula squamosa]|uniref:Uncharacterized protein n=1 Tax=Vespula squamosa TaxID=30214 RepID=A0ABD1ZWP3_VESSQ